MKVTHFNDEGSHWMISFRNVWFNDPLTEARIENVSFDLLEHEHRAVLCSSSAERLALVQLLSGSSKPDKGKISLPKSVSFPVASATAIQMRFSVINNIRILARMYGLRPKDLQNFVDKIIGKSYNNNAIINKLPRNDKISISLAMSYGVPFNLYIADTFALPPNDGIAYHNLARYLDYLNNQNRGLLLITEAPGRARDACLSASILKDNGLIHFNDIIEGINEFQKTKDTSKYQRFDKDRR